MSIQVPTVRTTVSMPVEHAAIVPGSSREENVGFAILALIRAYGVDVVFGIPGTHNLEFYRHLPRLGFRTVTTRHEQGAGYAADGWHQRTRLPGVVITTSGPGFLNSLAAAGTAYCESRPLIILTPGAPRGSEGVETGALHATKDQRAAAAGVVEWARRVSSASEAIEAVHDAFELARSSRPRPVVIEVPLDLLEACANLPAEALLPRQSSGLPVEVHGAVNAAARPKLTQPVLDEVEQVATVLAAARQPVILAGSGALPAGRALTELAELLDAPVITSLNAKGAVPESHPLSIGAELRLDAARRVANGSDALLVIGSKIAEAELWGGAIAPSGAMITVDILPSEERGHLQSTHAIIGHSALLVPALIASLRGRALSAEPQDVEAVRVACAAESSKIALVEDRLAARLAAVLPSDAVLTGDSSRITYYGMTSRVRSEEPGAFLYMATYATLGYGLPAAIGAKVASPDRPVIAVVGDGALMFSVQEFQTAVEQRLDLTVICVDNGGYGEIEQNQAERGIPPIGVRLTQPDWAALVDAFGGTGFRVTDAEELEAVVVRAIAHPGVTLVHVPFGLFGA
ncbi:thiamine pyrophosphate-binding protein [Agrococcus sp. KRD186]|uniref:thiamine pyrophosphate-binding protein n=1 Tax=Agrococcus sp. KRD186 TaxID=2729730 RepID=UPI001F497FA0|nr:thiamine pyrophosphate-binding protein [Agrococcus sp. KRD186]